MTAGQMRWLWLGRCGKFKEYLPTEMLLRDPDGRHASIQARRPGGPA